jgi:hypothetical protein
MVLEYTHLVSAVPSILILTIPEPFLSRFLSRFWGFQQFGPISPISSHGKPPTHTYVAGGGSPLTLPFAELTAVQQFLEQPLQVFDPGNQPASELRVLALLGVDTLQSPCLRL